VVYVAPLPVTASLPPELLAEVRQAFDGQERALAQEVRGHLWQQDHPWHSQRRDGTVSTELMAVAADLHRRYGDSAEIVISVRDSAEPSHHALDPAHGLSAQTPSQSWRCAEQETVRFAQRKNR
jgi:hypothetical protein